MGWPALGCKLGAVSCRYHYYGSPRVAGLRPEWTVAFDSRWHGAWFTAAHSVVRRRLRLPVHVPVETRHWADRNPSRNLCCRLPIASAAKPLALVIGR